MDPTTLFEDGIRQIDFVVVLETARIKLSPDDVTEATRLFDDDGEQLELWRKNYFMQGIISQGLEIEEEICNQEKLLCISSRFMDHGNFLVAMLKI